MAEKGRLIVTGANGFIGVRLIEMALAQGWYIVALARRHTRLASIDSPRLSLQEWNVCDPSSCRNVLIGADALCHLAAFIPPNYADPSYANECFRINALGALEMSKLALDLRVGRFILFSSGQIYSPREKPVTESDLVFPSYRAPFYLSSKLAAEVFVEHYRLVHGLPATILRLSSVYGAGMRDGGMISTFVRAALAGDSIKVHDDVAYHVDLVHVDDIVQASLNAVALKVDGTLNVGSGATSSALDVARVLVEVLNANPNLIEILPRSGLPADIGFSTLDISRARQVLGYSPASLREGMSKWLFGRKVARVET